MENNKKVIIVGAGLVGSLWAVYLSKAGYSVTIYERRPDIRKAEISAGKSINLALSNRGWKALDAVGVGDEIRKIAIPMYGRMMHDLAGNLTFQQYGKEDEAIYSVSRGKVNATMMDIAEKHGNATIHYNHDCKRVDLKNGIVYLKNTQTGEDIEAYADVIFAADGAFSAVRYNSMQKLDRFNYSQNFIADGYREILLPPNPDGTYRMDKNALHIWPRGRFMVIALANEDGSFTCTLFMPHTGGEHAFDKLTSKEAVDNFFKSVFPDFYEMMPNIADAWEDHPLSSLAIVRCYPWTSGKVALMGDAAHATVPFYGQGMNAGFEDISILNEIMQQYGDDWKTIFSEYQKSRKPNADAIAELSYRNFMEMSTKTADEKFLLQKKIEKVFSDKHPDLWIPLYSRVTFSDRPYAEALAIGDAQNAIMEEVLKMDNIDKKWDSEEVEDKILELLRLQ